MRAARAALLMLSSLPMAAGPDVPDFSGVWVQTQPSNGRLTYLQVVQSGANVQVKISNSNSFQGRVFGLATVENGTATWTKRESCIARFQWPGYDYSNPGVDTFKLSLGGDELVYVQEVHWNAPCANNHPIGTETYQKILKRQ